ncbi:MAG: protein translocase subunit SecD [Deferribacteraceae bacterium]|jgi:preprotein translocase subunit SecD|nr:protein translocase subunit SecD [Deferribacteraceae bacterium]
MSRRFRWAIIIIVVGCSLFFMFPLSKNVRLGLDLQGGMHVVLGVETEKAVEAKLDSAVYQLRREFQEKNINFDYVQKTSSHSIGIGFEGDSRTAIESIAKNYMLKSDGISNDVLTLSIESGEIEQIKDSSVRQSLEVVRNRIDAFGVAEPLIQRQGKDQILVQLPGVTDPDRAVNLIGQTAQLSFYLVDSGADAAVAVETGNIPYGDILVFQKETEKSSGRVTARIPYLLKREVLLTGDSLMDAGVTYNQYSEPVVSFRFDPAGARIFEDLTANNTGQFLAIVLDNNVYSAPRINERIPGGSGTITGNFTLDTAKDLAIVLRAGSLPAPVNILENRTVGPSLGRDSIEKGVKASIVGLVIIMIFMLIYYKISGLIATVGLICNFLVLLGALCGLKATLTLPGIAGIILTLGIAVDSNVLIFERIREELRNGRTVLNAFETGYQKAFATIVDANVTSLIAAIVLFQFGTGPVKGFAVTLSLGLIASMFTAVFITKTVFTEFIIRTDSKTISI